MSDPGLFDSLDQPSLGRVTGALGIALVAAAARVLPAFADDDTVSPVELRAGILKAHLLGALSAISTIIKDHDGPDDDKLLIAGIANFLRDEVAQIRRTQR